MMGDFKRKRSSIPNLNLALNKNGFFAKVEDRGGSRSNLFYTIGGEIDPFSGEKNGGAIKLKFEKGGLARMLGE